MAISSQLRCCDGFFRSFRFGKWPIWRRRIRWRRRTKTRKNMRVVDLNLDHIEVGYGFVCANDDDDCHCVGFACHTSSRSFQVSFGMIRPCHVHSTTKSHLLFFFFPFLIFRKRLIGRAQWEPIEFVNEKILILKFHSSQSNDLVRVWIVCRSVTNILLGSHVNVSRRHGLWPYSYL